jgi:hypothetical protein
MAYSLTEITYRLQKNLAKVEGLSQEPQSKWVNTAVENWVDHLQGLVGLFIP